MFNNIDNKRYQYIIKYLIDNNNNNKLLINNY